MQVGYVGLLKAIGGYDPAFGNGWRAYAVPCITGEIKRHLRDKRWQVRVIRPLQELLLKMRDVTEDLTHELGRLPGEGELAWQLGVSPDELREARRAADGFSALSLNAPAGDDGEDPAALGDLLGDDDAGFQQAIDMEAVERHWDELPHGERHRLVGSPLPPSISRRRRTGRDSPASCGQRCPLGRRGPRSERGAAGR